MLLLVKIIRVDVSKNNNTLPYLVFKYNIHLSAVFAALLTIVPPSSSYPSSLVSEILRTDHWPSAKSPSADCVLSSHWPKYYKLKYKEQSHWLRYYGSV